MSKLETILTLILFITISFLGFSLQEDNHAKEIEALQNRILILEEIIKNYEVIEALNDEIKLVAGRQAAIDDNEWIEWIAANRWILGIE